MWTKFTFVNLYPSLTQVSLDNICLVLFTLRRTSCIKLRQNPSKNQEQSQQSVQSINVLETPRSKYWVSKTPPDCKFGKRPPAPTVIWFFHGAPEQTYVTDKNSFTKIWIENPNLYVSLFLEVSTKTRHCILVWPVSCK